MHRSGTQAPVQGDNDYFPPARGPNPHQLGVSASYGRYLETEPCQHANDVAGLEPPETQHQGERAQVSKVTTSRGSGSSPNVAGSSSLR